MKTIQYIYNISAVLFGGTEGVLNMNDGNVITASAALISSAALAVTTLALLTDDIVNRKPKRPVHNFINRTSCVAKS